MARLLLNWHAGLLGGLQIRRVRIRYIRIKISLLLLKFIGFMSSSFNLRRRNTTVIYSIDVSLRNSTTPSKRVRNAIYEFL